MACAMDERETSPLNSGVHSHRSYGTSEDADQQVFEGAAQQVIDIEGADPQVIDTEGADPQVIDIESADPQVIDIEGADPQVIDIEGADPQVIDIEGTDPQVIDIEGAAPQVIDIEGADPQVIDTEGGADPQVIDIEGADQQEGGGGALNIIFKVVTSVCKAILIAFWPFVGIWWLTFSSAVQVKCLWDESGNDNVTMADELYAGNPQHAYYNWRWSHCHQPHKVQKALAYSLIVGLYKFAPGILIVRWCYQINLRRLLSGKINQAVVYDKRYLLALYVILWACSVLLNFSIKCASCEQLFTLRWTIRYFSHYQHDVSHAACALVSLLLYTILYLPSFFCCWFVIDLTNALVSLASDTEELADSMKRSGEVEQVVADRVLRDVFNRIKENSWSRHSGLGKEVEFFTKITMFVGAIVGFSFSNIYVSSKLSNFMEWAHHVTQLLYLAVTCMTPFFYIAAGVKKLHEAHEIFVYQARRAQMGKLCDSGENANTLEWEKWSAIIDTMQGRVASIVNTEKELCVTAFATMGVIFWHLLGHLNKFDDAPKDIIENERFALTYIVSLTLVLVILTVFAITFGSNMIPTCVKVGNRQGHVRVIVCSFLVGAATIAVVYVPWWLQFKNMTCKL